MPPMSEEECKARKREYNKAHYEANKERKLTYAKAYREANRDRILSYSRNYFKSYREANKEKIAERNKAYYESNKDYYLAKTRERQCLIKKAIPKQLRKCPIETDRLLKIYKLRAIISEATGVEHHVDHMWPLSDGGPHWSGNLQIITAEENLSKSASVCEETKNVMQESLEYALQEYKKEKRCM